MQSNKSTIPALLLFFLVSTATSTLFGYRKDLENSTDPEAFQGLLAAFGLQLSDGQGVPGFLVVAEDDPNAPSLQTNQILDEILNLDPQKTVISLEKPIISPEPSDACSPVKPPPNVAQKFFLKNYGVDIGTLPSKTRPKTIQFVNHQSRSKIMQKL